MKIDIKNILIFILLLIICYMFILGNRYEIVASGESGAYKLDKWTGDIYLVYSRREVKIKKVQDINNIPPLPEGFILDSTIISLDEYDRINQNPISKNKAIELGLQKSIDTNKTTIE